MPGRPDRPEQISKRLSFPWIRSKATWVVVVSFLIQLVLVGAVAWLSRWFGQDGREVDRPILSVLVLLSLAFAAQLACLLAALRLKDTIQLRAAIFCGAVLLRCVMLPSQPIQEVDLYRYIWDGAVVAQGIDPYRWSPQQIAEAWGSGQSESADPLERAFPLSSTESGTNPDKLHLVRLLSENPGLAQVHARVHFAELTTVYPPVSQGVFAMAYLATPKGASLHGYVLVMKLFILAFDLGVLGLLMVLLRCLNQHSGWSLVYASSPLVLKEFANSGHLDSIAVFFTMASLVALVAGIKRCTSHESEVGVASQSTPCTSAKSVSIKKRYQFGSAVLLAMGVGAKLFPIVLFPCFLRWQTLRNESETRAKVWLRAMGWTSAFALTTLVCLWPMFRTSEPTGASDSGLKTFVSSWEMNDLIFMVVEENLRPEGTVSGQPSLWFVGVPDAWRRGFCAWTSGVFAIDEEQVPFFATRAITIGFFFLLVAAWIWRIHGDARQFLEVCFLTLAWFWMLAPTQNPWYWVWALPLVVFATNRAWLLTSALVLMYYLRFWFQYHSPTWTLGGQTYRGTAIFDFWIVWAEFAPLLALLAWGSFTHRPGWLVRTSGGPVAKRRETTA